jgi:hypothetical protein
MDWISGDREASIIIWCPPACKSKCKIKIHSDVDSIILNLYCFLLFVRSVGNCIPTNKSEGRLN